MEEIKGTVGGGTVYDEQPNEIDNQLERLDRKIKDIERSRIKSLSVSKINNGFLVNPNEGLCQQNVYFCADFNQVAIKIEELFK